ncbi:MAG: hypothetical protein ACI82O_002634 [Patiriisocius sp.]|jgi:hypothetical protein
MNNPPLRIGLLLNGDAVPEWVKVLLDDIQESDFGTIVLRIYDNGPVRADNYPNYGLRDRIVMKLAVNIHQRFAEGPSRVKDAFVPCDITSQLEGIASLYVDTDKTRYVDRVADADIKTIDTYNLDVIIRIGFGILDGDILHVAKHGIWSLHHGDNRVNRGGPPAFWETMQSWDTVGAILQQLNTEIDNGLILSRGQGPVDRFSLAQTRNNLYWKAQSMIFTELQRLHLLGANDFFAPDRLPEQSDFQFYSHKLFNYPTPGEYLKLSVKKFCEKVTFVARNKRYLDQWVLMFHFSDKPLTSPRRYKTLLPPKECFWADPFVMEREGKYFIYVEEYPYATRKGHISVIEMDSVGNVGKPQRCLETDYHLSYPFLLEHETELYMIPESVSNNAVELYRCTQFPNKWEYVQDIMSNVQLVDATLYFHDGLWWLFGNQSNGNRTSRWDECNLYFTKDFRDGNWQPHPANPISADVRQARPAGAIFCHNGKLFRPAQNCSKHYGYGFSISEINTMTPEKYQETLISRVEPQWDDCVIGTHTYNRTGRLTVIDAIRLRKR